MTSVHTFTKMELADIVLQKNTNEVICLALEYDIATLEPHSGKVIVAEDKCVFVFALSDRTKSSFTFDVECPLLEKRKWGSFWTKAIDDGCVQIRFPRNIDVVHEIRVTGAEPQSSAVLSSSAGVICAGTVDGDGCCRLKCRLLTFLLEFTDVWVTVKGPKLGTGITATTIDSDVRNKYKYMRESYRDVCVCNERIHENMYVGGLYGLKKVPVPKWLQNRELTGRGKF